MLDTFWIDTELRTQLFLLSLMWYYYRAEEKKCCGVFAQFCFLFVRKSCKVLIRTTFSIVWVSSPAQNWGVYSSQSWGAGLISTLTGIRGRRKRRLCVSKRTTKKRQSRKKFPSLTFLCKKSLTFVWTNAVLFNSLWRLRLHLTPSWLFRTVLSHVSGVRN